MLGTFPSASKALNLSSVFSPQTPICQNPDFPTGCSSSFLHSLWPTTGPTTGEFFCKGEIQDRVTLTVPDDHTLIRIWVYMQICHFLMDINHRKDYGRQLTSYERLCISTTMQRHLISKIYTLFYADTAADADLACSQWTSDISTLLTEGDWEDIHPKAFSSSKNVNV